MSRVSLRRRRPRGDRGDTLVELLATVMIMGIAVTVILGAVAATLRFTDMHRKQAVAGAAVREFAERIESSVAAPTSGYKAACPAGTAKTAYESTYTKPAGFEREVVAVAYWNGSIFTANCADDIGVQRVTLHVWSADNRADERLDVIVRKPCRIPPDPAC
jgi:type II secretory pathway pseudopilin PulG